MRTNSTVRHVKDVKVLRSAPHGALNPTWLRGDPIRAHQLLTS
jgi:hypothetical protein